MAQQLADTKKYSGHNGEYATENRKNGKTTKNDKSGGKGIWRENGEKPELRTKTAERTKETGGAGNAEAAGKKGDAVPKCGAQRNAAGITAGAAQEAGTRRKRKTERGFRRGYHIKYAHGQQKIAQAFEEHYLGTFAHFPCNGMYCNRLQRGRKRSDVAWTISDIIFPAWDMVLHMSHVAFALSGKNPPVGDWRHLFWRMARVMRTTG